MTDRSTGDLCIVVPCFNEAKKFDTSAYINFIDTHPAVLLCFVNDGSTDGTVDHLWNINQTYPEQVEVISYERNQGKAEAVRKGILHCIENHDFNNIAFLDADLAVSLEECLKLSNHICDTTLFCFGSRILKLGSIIERKRSRFLIGRLVATLISETLALKIYDTQCGCKIFTRGVAEKLFSAPFISRWLFDVELFFRMMQCFGRESAVTKMKEVPLDQWIDRGDSKVRVRYMFRLVIDLYRIGRKYSSSNMDNPAANIENSIFI